MNRGSHKMPVAFDTLAFSNKLKNAGVDPKIADAQSEATAGILNDLIDSQLATKQDLSFLRQEVAQDISALRQEVTQDISALRQEVTQDISALKQDMSSFKQEIRQDMTIMKQEVKQDMLSLKIELSSLFFKMITSSIIILGALQTLFHFIK